MCFLKSYIPKILYKYIDFIGGKAMIEKHSLKYCPINELNDPFEFMPGGYDMTHEALSQQAETIFENNKLVYLKKIREQYPNISESNLKKILDVNRTTIIQKLYIDLQNRNWEHFIDMASKRYGVLSLCEEPTNILMWSHYADSHKGIVIGINSCVLTNPQQVHYTSKRPILKASFDSSEEEYKDAVVKLMTTKAIEWKYEKEWRCIENLEKLTSVTIDKNTLHLDLSLSLDSIKEIYFGAKMSNENKEAIKSLFSGNSPDFFNLNYSHSRYLFDIERVENLI